MRLLIFAGGALLMGMPDVGVARDPQLLYSPTAETARQIEPLAAMARIRAAIDARHNIGWPCSTTAVRFAPVPSYTLTGRRLTIRCADNSEYIFPFASLTAISVNRSNDGTYACALTATSSFCIFPPNSTTLVETAQEIADAFFVLSRPRVPQDAATDAPFLASIEAARTAGDRSEAQRRAQVQAEALLHENRLAEVVQLYREALQASPDWAQGHYNLALVLGTLEFHPEAITEMRRYLLLAPNAADARAATDQIYTWEALMPRPAAPPAQTPRQR